MAAAEVNAQMSREQLEAVLRDNAGYRFDSTLAQVRLFITASEALCSLPLTEFEQSGTRAAMDVRVVKERLEAAIRWWELKRHHAARPRVSYADMSNWDV